MKIVNGWAFPDVDDFMWREMKPDGTYQAGHVHQAMAHVTDRTLAIDGGAHVGTWSKILGGLFDRVLAIEPSHDTYEALVTNMHAFGCQNVECRHEALGAEPGMVSMTMDPRAEALQNTGGRFVRADGDITRVRIDDWKVPSLGFLKLDVEGSEPLALEGAAETLQRCKPIVLFENKGFCRRYGLQPDAPHRVLGRLGFQFLERAGKDEIWGPK